MDIEQSEEEGDGDPIEQVGIYTLDEAREEAEQEGALKEGELEPEISSSAEQPTWRDGQTAPWPPPTTACCYPQACEAAQQTPDITHYYPQTDVVTTSGAYVVGEVVND